MSRGESDRLLLEHMASAGRLAVRLTGDPDMGEDVMQEALVRASRSWRTFRGQSRFSTWLMRIVVNAFRGCLARRSAAGGLPGELPDGKAADPSAELSAREIGQAVAAAVSALPPRQREVLVLRAYEGLSTAEVCELLGIDEGTARANLHYARRRLRERLAGHLGKDDT